MNLSPVKNSGLLDSPLYILLLVIFAVIPLSNIFGQYQLGLIMSILLLSLFAISFNLLFGYTGLLSFGHAAFFGTAAYTIAILLNGQITLLPGWTGQVLPAIGLALAVTLLVSIIIGFFSVQLDNIYFAMLTLTFSMILYQIAFQWSGITGGDSGLIVSLKPIEIAFLTIDITGTQTLYYFILIVVVGSLVLLRRVVNSPYGRLLIAIRENSERAEMVGIPVKLYKFSSFIISGFFAGIAGILFSFRNIVITPETLHWTTSADPVLMTLLGGPTTFFGPAVGAFLFVFLEEILTNFTNHWHIGLGLILIPIVLFAPGGFMGLILDYIPSRWRSMMGMHNDMDNTNTNLEEDEY